METKILHEGVTEVTLDMYLKQMNVHMLYGDRLACIFDMRVSFVLVVFAL